MSAPKYKIKATAEAWPHAVDLMADMMANGARLLGPNAGDTYAETVAGITLIAKRKCCGGVDVREARINRADAPRPSLPTEEAP